MSRWAGGTGVALAQLLSVDFAALSLAQILMSFRSAECSRAARMRACYLCGVQQLSLDPTYQEHRKGAPLDVGRGLHRGAPGSTLGPLTVSMQQRSLFFSF